MALVGALVWAIAVPSTSAGAQPSIRAEALQQMTVLMVEKTSRTAAQQKVDSRLLFEIRKRRGEALLHTLPVRTHVELEDGRVLVDVTATVDDALLRRVDELGGETVSAFPQFDALRARLPLSAVEALAGWPAVRIVRPADEFLRQGGFVTQGGINTTEGDVAHGADTARVLFGVDGTGVQAGAMSDSVDELPNLQASGDLPPGVTVLPGQSGNPGTSEGTALLEILFDMAPGADLFFATGRGGQAQMAQNILDLAAAGCDVIVDDILYFAEPVFQDGVIAQAVDTVAAAGVLYFSAAGNSGNLDSGTSGVWEGDYAPTSLPPPLDGAGVSAHDFDAGDNANTVTEVAPNDAPFFTLQWSDPQGGSDNDYDLFLLDAALANVLDFSTNTQNGTQNPFEIIDSVGVDDTGNRLVVVLFDGDERFLHLNTHRGRLEFPTDGQIFGHPAAEGAMAVAAVDVATAGGGVFTGGAANPVEEFSSDGPRRIFFLPDGTPVPLAVRGQSSVGASADNAVLLFLRGTKPEIAAADGVETATPGFETFFGTSASAPHAAAIGALYLEQFPSVPVPLVQDVFLTTALDIDAPGFDRNSGAGILMAVPPLELGEPIFLDGFESGDTSAWSG